MNCENELSLLLATLKKCHISAKAFTLSEQNQTDESDMFSPMNIIDELEENSVYRVCDSFRLNYIYMLLKSGEVLFVGPFLFNQLSNEELLEIAEKNNIPPLKQNTFSKFYYGVPVVSEGGYLLSMIDAFAEQIFGDKLKFNFIDLSNDIQETASLFSNNEAGDNAEQILTMHLMEQRYSYENEIMEAVARGQVQKADLILSGVSKISFERRLSDSIRNIKNYSIIMNTLLRKAAENGGVHPIYLDKISSTFAAQIEMIHTTDAGYALMKDMFRSYCKLVQKHSIKNYSPPVQKALVCIDANLSNDLSLSALSTLQNISSGYLSALFKKEVGKNVTEYINEKRIDLAKKLLTSTKLQIQTVASHCGILDVHYFSKLFKKYTGKTPKEYRKS